MTEKEEKCPWEETEEGSFRADCGGFFEFGDGTPSSNGFKFCPYCGKAIVEVPFVGDFGD